MKSTGQYYTTAATTTSTISHTTATTATSTISHTTTTTATSTISHTTATTVILTISHTLQFHKHHSRTQEQYIDKNLLTSQKI